MLRRYSIPLLVTYCGTLALGCGDDPWQENDATAEFSAALFAANPPVSDEIEIATPTMDRRASVDAKIAFGAGEYLVVWSIPTYYPSAHMYGTRITQSGEVLDPSGFYIGPGYPADVAFANGQFVVVSTPIAGNSSGDIRVTRISSSGLVLDPGGIIIVPDDVNSIIDVFPTIASDGVDFLIAWTENSIFPTVFRALRFVRMNANGVVLDIEPGGKLITELVPWTYRPSLAFDGNQFLLAWSPSFDFIYGLRISKSGETLDPNPIVIDDVVGNHVNVKAIFDGTQFIVASGIDVNSNPMLRLRRVASSGIVDPVTSDIPTGFPTAIFSQLDFDGQQLVVTLDDATLNKTYSLHVSLGGNVVEPVAPLLAENSAAPRVAANASGQSMFVWTESPSSVDVLQGFATGMRMDASGKKLDTPSLPMSVRAGAQDAPRAAFDGDNYWLAWRDTKGFTATRVSLLGNVSDALDLPFSPESIDKSSITHVLSSGGSSGLTWIAATQSGTTGSTRVVRVATDGTLLDPVPFQLPPSSLGSLAAPHYVAGVDPQGILFVGAQDASIPFAIRVANDGSVQPLALIGDQSCIPHSLTFDGVGYFLTCSTPTGTPPAEDFEGTLQGARISTKGELLDSGWMPLAKIENATFDSLVASFDGKNHWLVWRTDEWGEGYWSNFPHMLGLHALGVTSTGQVLEPEPILIAKVDGCSTAAERSLRPAVESVNGKTFVVWSESANPTSCDSFYLNLFGIEIDQAGVTTPKFIVSEQLGAEESPALAANPDGQLLVTYSRFVPTAPYNAERAQARLISACVCDNGQSCVDGTCTSTTGGGNSPNMPPISFGGCGCRFADDATTNGFSYAVALAALAAWTRRRQRDRA